MNQISTSCKMIAEAIADERKGKEFYTRLSNNPTELRPVVSGTVASFDLVYQTNAFLFRLYSF